MAGLKIKSAWVSRWVYRLKYPFKLWAYELIDQWVMYWHPHKPSGKVLMYRLDLIGDYLMCRPFFKALMADEAWQGMPMVFAGNMQCSELATWLDADAFTDFIWIDRPRFMNSLGYRFSILKKIRLAGFELVIYPSHTRQYWLESVVRVSGARRKITGERVGTYMNAWEDALTTPRYTEVLKTGPKGIFEFYRNQNFFYQLTSYALEIKSLYQPLPPLETRFLPTTKPYLVVAPGASTQNRQWPVDRYAVVARQIAIEKNMAVVVMGGPAEKVLGQQLVAELPGLEVHNLAGLLTLAQSMVLLKQAHFLLSNESAPVHMAATTGTKTVCISQGNHFGRWNPYPKEIAGWIETVYPTRFGDVYQHFDAMVHEYHEGSTEEIASVGVDTVLKILNEEEPGTPFPVKP